MHAMIKTNGVSLNLDMETVKKYICPKASEKEIYMFLQICKVQQLNPFLREIYLVKYGDRDPASTLIGIETFRKRASRNPKYMGHTTNATGEGTSLTATTDVFVEGYKVPISCTVEYEEYVGRKRDGSTNKFWASKPKTMLKKVSEAQALRTAFPEEFGGLYSIEEINSIPPVNLPTDPVDVTESIVPLVIEEKFQSPEGPAGGEMVRDWVDAQTNIAKLSKKHNEVCQDDPELASYIKGTIDSILTGGPSSE